MPIDQVNVVRMCGEHRHVIETITVKMDNMRLLTDEEVWCPECNAYTPEARDIAGRQESIRQEQQSYPESPSSGPPRMASKS